MKIVQPDTNSINHAADMISQGRLVAIPTETVYGLAGDATNDMAVARIYEIKGRPQINPLILHVESLDQAKEYAEFSELAETLAHNFWPGPLTLVLPLKDESRVSKLVTAGLETVAVRCPDNQVTLDLIHTCGRPLAAPSANPSTCISPTRARHVFEGFKGLEEPSLILDGGNCKVGLESTVIDLTSKIPIILRPGSINEIHLKPFCEILPLQDGEEIKAPGMMFKHYAPKHSLRMNAQCVSDNEVLLAFGSKPLDGAKQTFNLSPEADLVEAAANLFAMLYEIDQIECSGIAVMSIPEEGLGIAINDRLKRAAA